MWRCFWIRIWISLVCTLLQLSVNCSNGWVCNTWCWKLNYSSQFSIINFSYFSMSIFDIIFLKIITDPKLRRHCSVIRIIHFLFCWNIKCNQRIWQLLDVCCIGIWFVRRCMYIIQPSVKQKIIHFLSMLRDSDGGNWEDGFEALCEGFWALC